jgi:hypothetical protein
MENVQILANMTMHSPMEVKPMPTMLNGSIKYTPTSGVTVNEAILQEQPETIYRALTVMFDFSKDDVECKEHLCSGGDPIVPHCDCNIPLDIFLLLQRRVRTQKERSP